MSAIPRQSPYGYWLDDVDPHPFRTFPSAGYGMRFQRLMPIRSLGSRSVDRRIGADSDWGSAADGQGMPS